MEEGLFLELFSTVRSRDNLLADVPDISCFFELGAGEREEASEAGGRRFYWK